MRQASPSLQHPLRRGAKHPAQRDPLSVSAASATELCGACRRIAAKLLTLLLLLGAAQVAPGQSHTDLTELSLESLMNIEVTSVSRREQKLSQSASAIYVITQEDIRRSGVTTLPDALRMAPGVQVAQISGNQWAVSIRGFNGRFARKLLVMIDGRSVYHPAFAGVYWEANDVLLEDVDRIEVIRGPGATMWGSNAVNGVINIITKHTRDTQGGLLTGGGGNQEGGFGAARFGGEAGAGLHYRLYSKYFSRSGQFSDSGERASDNWLKAQSGFRVDWEPSENNTILLSGDAYSADGGDRLIVPLLEPPYALESRYRASFSGVNLLGRWTRKHSERAHTHVQAFVDHTTRDDVFIRGASATVGDIELEHQIDLERHTLVGGVGYRANKDSHPVDWVASYHPRQRTTQRVNAFVQDEMTLLPGKLLLALGSKFEKNTFTGLEVQPSASLLWNRSDRDTAWISIARAARAPSRVDHDVIVQVFAQPGPDGALILGQSLGNPDIRPEYLVAYEAGYRLKPTLNWSFDLAGFYHVHDDIVTHVQGSPFLRDISPPVVVVPLVATNALSARVYGAELAAAWRVTPEASLRLNYSFLRGGIDTFVDVQGPSHQAHARWFWSLPHNLEWDSGYYFTDSYSGVPAYHRVDSRFGWRPHASWEVSVTAQHLLDDRHREGPALLALPTEIGRSVYGKLTWRF
jgi:iron complex outermembrane recepter protein